MTETLCTSGSVKLKAGSDAPELTTAQYTSLINQAEGMICATCRVNYIDSYAGLNADVKYILEDAASSYAACSAIAYTIGNFPSRILAETIMDVNWAKFNECMKLLKEKYTTSFINNA